MIQLQKLMSYLIEKHPEYHEYFNSYYVPNVREWATCFRVGTLVNTNMYLESFHRLLKVVYLNNKQNRRVDKLVHVLFRIARNLLYEQLSKLEKGKLTHRRCEINKRHKSAMAMNCKVETLSDGESWKVESSKGNGEFYIITHQKESCTCQLYCSTCTACIHMYLCTCLDATLHNTVCKHIHYIHVSVAQIESDNRFEGSEAAMEFANEVPSEVHDDSDQVTGSAQFNREYFAQLLQQDATTDVTVTKNDIENLSQNILSLMQGSAELETLKTVKDHLKSAVSLLQAKQRYPSVTENKENLIPPKVISPNSNHKQQISFFSTKKRGKKRQKSIRKPTMEEQKRAKVNLSSTEVKVCGICWNTDDSDTAPEVSWIACDQCGYWVHSTCIEGESVNGYICLNCS